MEGKPDRKSRSAMSTQAAETPRSNISVTNTSALKRLSSKDRKDKSRERKKRRRKEIEIHRIPGVRRIALSELSQKIINCVVGEHITSEKPWTLVKKELIEDNLELHEESSEFLPIRNEIIAFPRKEMLIGFITEEAGEIDEFYICVTEAATDAVQTLINEQQAKQEARLQNSINKVIKSWLTLGSEAEIDETIPKKNRALLEVEIESKYPILPFKIQFRLRTVEKARDGYMELTTKDETMSHVFRKRIDNDTQVTPAFRENEAQTICTYPSNASTQYEYCIDMDENVWRSYGGQILNYLNKNLSDLMNSLSVNRNINLYLDEYQILGTNTITKRSLLYLDFLEYMAFNDVQLCKGKMISCAHWHQMITGLVAISYADLSMNIFLKKPSTIDEVSQAINGTNPVLIWSFVDPLNPRLILETHREITTISMCTFNENLVVGGAVNGQIVLWDIKNRIQKVEEQEILTNAQTKYRSYMRSLMTWMKDIHDVKVVRATAVSDLRHSHAGAVVRIQWISPFEEVGRMGKAHQFFEDTEERSLQFMTAGEDGVVMIWDLLKKPTIGTGGFRERRLKRLKQRPAGLSSEVSPFRVLHLNLKPVYKINLVHPKESRLLPISMMNYMNHEIAYEKTDPLSASMQSICARQTYQARPVYLDRPFVSKFLIGTMEGDFAEAQWEGRDFDLGAVVNSENCMYIQFNKFHDGPIFTIAKHSCDKLKLTAGGKVFAIWSDDFREHPIFWRRSKVYYTHASWYKFFPNRFRLLRSDGLLEIWCITTCSKKPSHSLPVSSGELVSANIHPRNLKQSCLGISDALGNFRIFCLRREDASKVQNAILEESIVDYIDREVKRKKKFLAWQKEWDEKYAKKLEVPVVVKPKTSEELLKEALEQADTEAESKKEEKKDKVKFTEEGGEKKKDRPAPGRYLEWVREKELAKEQERIKKMILKKKSLDTEELEKQRKPLLKLEQENELRRKKQRARIKGSETIFKETVAMLFPAIVKEKPTPPPDPYAGGDPIEEKRKCYAYFSEITDTAERYMKNTKVELDFDWTSVLKEGRGRRKYLDNTFAKATHHERYESYKSTRMERKVPQIVTNLASEVDQTSMKDEGDDDAEEDVDDIEPPTDA